MVYKELSCAPITLDYHTLEMSVRLFLSAAATATCAAVTGLGVSGYTLVHACVMSSIDYCSVLVAGWRPTSYSVS